MGQSEARSVKRVTRELEEREVFLGELTVRRSREARLIGAVELVPDDGRPKAREVDADLMLAARLELTTDECVGRAFSKGACPLDEETR
jgi:hypothetical protein